MPRASLHHEGPPRDAPVPPSARATKPPNTLGSGRPRAPQDGACTSRSGRALEAQRKRREPGSSFPRRAPRSIGAPRRVERNSGNGRNAEGAWERRQQESFPRSGTAREAGRSARIENPAARFQRAPRRFQSRFQSPRRITEERSASWRCRLVETRFCADTRTHETNPERSSRAVHCVFALFSRLGACNPSITLHVFAHAPNLPTKRVKSY
jgi:hypothetical protein